MLLPQAILSLPPAIVLLITSFVRQCDGQTNSTTSDFALDVRYFPEHEYFGRRDLDVQQRIQNEGPIAVRKMSGDPGEKFYLDYWQFAADVGWTNQSLLSPFENAFPFHSTDTSTFDLFPRYLNPGRLSLFSKRDYQCPSGTYACTSIGRPNSCCSADSTCQVVQDTGSGDVGCCPAGTTCGGDLSSCASGYTACNGGGCCLPGYGCFDVGCVQTNTAVVVVPAATVQPATVTVTSTVWTTPVGGAPVIRTSTYTTIVDPPSTSTSSSVAPPPPPPSTSESTTTTTSITSTTTTRSTPTSLPCPSNFRSCPATLGGGCCYTERACGSGKQCLATTATTNPVPPVLPTTDVTTRTSVTSSTSVSGCPTGFYACSAYYEGGCCQVDRNCDKTSCPTRASTTLLSDSITAVAPTGSGITAPGSLLTGNCAKGWSSCAPSLKGGCCPAGYACGTATCSATASGGGGNQVGKEAPNGSHSGRVVDMFGLIVTIFASSAALGLGIWL